MIGFKPFWTEELPEFYTEFQLSNTYLSESLEQKYLVPFNETTVPPLTKQTKSEKRVYNWKKVEIFLFTKNCNGPSFFFWSMTAELNVSLIRRSFIFFLPLFSQAVRKEQAQYGSKSGFVYHPTTGYVGCWALNKPENIYLLEAWVQPFLRAALSCSSVYLPFLVSWPKQDSTVLWKTAVLFSFKMS